MAKSSHQRRSFESTICRLTGINVKKIRDFLKKDAYVPGEGFDSQYAGRGKVSCATTAICAYALAETGQITTQERTAYRNALLEFRDKTKHAPGAAFPRTPSLDPNVWSTGQSVLALLALGTEWSVVKPSVRWLIDAQGRGGGWNYAGDQSGNERLIYTLYPVLALHRVPTTPSERGKPCAVARARVRQLVQRENRSLLGSMYRIPSRDGAERRKSTAPGRQRSERIR